MGEEKKKYRPQENVPRKRGGDKRSKGKSKVPTKESCSLGRRREKGEGNERTWEEIER